MKIAFKTERNTRKDCDRLTVVVRDKELLESSCATTGLEVSAVSWEPSHPTPAIERGAFPGSLPQRFSSSQL